VAVPAGCGTLKFINFNPSFVGSALARACYRRRDPFSSTPGNSLTLPFRSSLFNITGALDFESEWSFFIPSNPSKKGTNLTLFGKTISDSQPRTSLFVSSGWVKLLIYFAAYLQQRR
jgi:hypothetical protein